MFIFILFSLLLVPIFRVNYKLKNDIPVLDLNPPTVSYGYDMNWPVNGRSICTETGYQGTPQICSDGFGGAIIAWEDGRSSPDEDIYAQRVDSNGVIQWKNDGEAISTASGSQVHIQICSDGEGGAIIVWKDDRYSIGNYDIFARRIDMEGTVKWTHDGVPICTNPKNQADPQICSDGSGGAIITWFDYRSGTNYDIYAQHVNSEGVVSWTIDGKPICTATNHQFSPKICSDGIGGAYITWYDLRSGSNYDIYAQRINSAGFTTWTPNGVAICTESYDQIDPQICMYSSNKIFITWSDYRSGSNYDIYLNLVNSSGYVFLPSGAQVCAAVNDQIYPKITSSANIVWQDYRSGSAYDIYACRAGAPETVVCSAVDSQFEPQLCNDGAGGALVVWYDSRNGFTDYNIYIQRINIYGDVKWTLDGYPVCTVGNNQLYPQICSDGTGGAIVTWQDERSGTFDIYAQRIKNDIPTSNHPGFISTSIGGSETIDWVLNDDCDGGKYRILKTDDNGNSQLWIGWTSWDKSVPINVPIDRSSPGIYNYTIEYYDDQNQFGDPDLVIVKITPIITINLPTPNQLCGKQAPNFNVEVDEPNLDKMWYSFDGGTTKVIFPSNGSINQAFWESYGSGTLYLRFYANNTSGNSWFEQVTIEKDSIAPQITIIYPSSNSNFTTTPAFELSIIEAQLDEVWYTLDDGITNISISAEILTGVISPSIWEECPLGSVTIRFYANDTLGNVGSKEIVVYKTESLQNGNGMPMDLLIILLALFSVAILLTAVIAVRPKIRKSKFRKKLRFIAKEELERFKNKMNDFIIAKLKNQYNDDWWDKGIPDDIKNKIDKNKKLKGKK